MSENPFSKVLPNLQIAWDQTSMSALEFCPRRYFYEIIQGWVPRKEPINFIFGRIYHSSLETFDKLRAGGTPFASAQDAALDHCLTESFGWESEDKFRNRETLIRTVVWYTEHYKDDQVQTYITPKGDPAVELSFRVEAGFRSITREDYILTGHMDRVIIFFDGSILPEERKTTGKSLNQSYYETFSPNLQVTWYIYGSQVILPKRDPRMLISAAQVAVGFSEFGRTIAQRNSDDFSEFRFDLGHQLFLAERFAEENAWPKYERNCWICPFKEVCRKPKSLRNGALEADFAKRTWNPLESR